MSASGIAYQAPPLRWALSNSCLGWRACRLKDAADINRSTLPEATEPDRVFRYVDIGSVGSDGELTDGEELTFAAAPSRARRLVAPGDSIVSTVRTYLRAIAQIGDDAKELVVSTGFATITPRTAIDRRYLYWWLRASPFVEEVVARSVGVSYPAVTASQVGDVAVLVPPPEEQRQIAEFLDAETARIDELVREQENIARLLIQRQRRLASDLTHALASVALNYGGSTDLPAGWCSMQLRRCLASTEYGIGEASKASGEIAVLGMGNVNDDGAIVGSPGGFVDDVDPSLILRPGDLLFNRTNSLAKVGKVGLVRQTVGPTTAASYLVIVRVNELATPDYLNYLLNTEEILGVARSMAIPSVNQANLNPTRYGSVRVPLPPVEEQRAIAQELDEARRHVDSVLAEVEVQCSLLREHRQALITAAVTGGLDAVRKVA